MESKEERMSHCAIKLAAAEAQVSPLFKGKQQSQKMKQCMDKKK